VENALPLFGLAAVLVAAALTIRVVADWWLRSKQLDVAERTAVPTASIPDIEARLARIEQAVETTAVEVERIAEAQRFTSRLLAKQQAPQSLVSERPAGNS
jgi:hypothetical protein